MQSDLQETAKFFPVITILGPRQVVKTTLGRVTFSNHAYVNFENASVRNFAESDPRRFLTAYSNQPH